MLPAALLLVALAASVGLACVGWQEPTESEAAEDFRRRLLADLTRVLPAPANDHAVQADRLRVTLERRGGAFTHYLANVVAVGDFTPANARDFALVARQRSHPSHRPGTLHLYSDAAGGRKLVATYGLDQSPAITSAITARLPPPAPGFPNRVDVALAADGLVDRYTITVVAPFPPEAAAELASFVRQFHSTLPGDNRFVVKLTSNARGTWVVLAQFDSTQEK